MSETDKTTCFEPWNEVGKKPLIEFRGVSKKFGALTAIDNVSFNIYEREFFALLGPSGCGKTTLMRMLGGFETPSQGQIFIDGKDISTIPANQRSVNMMFQSYALFPHLTVADNIAFGLKRSDMPKSEIAGRVDEMIKLVQLGNLGGRKPHQISGGQRQRVALARSLAKAPKLLLLDEPLGALDKKLRQETQFELVDIQEKLGTTFVIVTHDQEEAMTVSSRIGIMDQGKLIQIDTPDRIYEAPNSVRVADFIGDVNLIEGNATTTADDKVIISWAEGQPTLTAQTTTNITDGAKVTFAIRPEKIAMTTDKPTDASNAIEGHIHDIAYLGNVSIYKVRLSSGHMIKAQAANTRRLSRRNYTWEDKVWLSWTDTAGIVLTK
ncbi:MAG: polyamine ABC transporter ATP-binding protein [Hyphomicrobiales bacterium]|nr:MAG: polyamine ABC transporter ATP-binding protein [Hyphomicrobiales bacterium]